ncbi:MAG: hypothetical protein R3E39_08285, partial [Anaerolineae bacterium]
MKDITVEKITTVNLVALDAALRSALGAFLIGVTHTANAVTVHTTDDTSVDTINKVKTIVESHDPAQLTPDQQAEILAQAKLEQARTDYAATELDLKVFAGKDALLEQLAQKV